MRCNFNRVLVLSPHVDDGELGCGGTMAKWIEEGKEIYYVAFSWCGKSIPKRLPPDILKRECVSATTTLGVSIKRLFLLDYDVRTFPEFRQEILDSMIEFKKKIKPELILVPSSHDTHQDHHVIYQEAIRAFKKEASIWGYEQPWNNLSFTTDIFVKLNKGHLDLKLKALKKYKSQLGKSYFDKKYLHGLEQTRGMQIYCSYAEAFELVRMIL